MVDILFEFLLTQESLAGFQYQIVMKIRPNADILLNSCYQVPFNLRNNTFSSQNRAISRVVVDILFQFAESNGQFFPIL